MPSLHIDRPKTLHIHLEERRGDMALSLSAPIVSPGAQIRDYEGPYTVRPAPHEEQVLGTRGKRMADDVTVQEIPYYLTSNPSEGYTAIIGE